MLFLCVWCLCAFGLPINGLFAFIEELAQKCSCVRIQPLSSAPCWLRCKSVDINMCRSGLHVFQLVEKFYIFINFAAVLCFILFLSMERHWRSDTVKVLMAVLRMLLQRWLVPGGVCCPARPHGQQETRFVSL